MTEHTMNGPEAAEKALREEAARVALGYREDRYDGDADPDDVEVGALDYADAMLDQHPASFTFFYALVTDTLEVLEPGQPTPYQVEFLLAKTPAPTEAALRQAQRHALPDALGTIRRHSYPAHAMLEQFAAALVGNVLRMKKLAEALDADAGGEG